MHDGAPAFTLRMRDFVPNRTLPRRLIGGDEKGWHPAKVSRRCSAPPRPAARLAPQAVVIPVGHVVREHDPIFS